MCWNVVGVVVLALAAISSRSVALTGFGLDSLIEIGASMVVLWELAGVAQDRQRRAMRLIGASFVAVAIYLAVQSTVVRPTGKLEPEGGTQVTVGEESQLSVTTGAG